ncbi:tape measure protein [Microbacterium allomyrinae]|uniref:Tape measure protein n=1 Tax=Microbacterium allomyrinae TaxID=2830666 RepID=A0A9X1LTM5_9MICO|nr:tape measure protein [Microbacterium allomyrinae]MCC2031834.1 tape measure protein [Microbacterium allomyrinae]
MANPFEIAKAYVALSVRMRGVQRDIEVELGKADVAGVGDDLGKRTGRGFSTGFAAVAGAVGGIVATIAQNALQSIGDVVGEARIASDATQKFAQTLGFAGVDDRAIKTLSKSTRAYADQTVYDLTTIQNTTAQLASNGIKDYDQLAEAGGNLNAVAGGNAETFKSVGMVLTQTAGQGKLTTENWNQLADAIPGASGKLQEALQQAGAYTGNFRDAMEKGEISAEEFNAAIMTLGNQPIAVEAAKSVETMEGSWGNLQATIVGGLSDVITWAKPALTGFVNGFAEVFKGLFATVGEVGNFVRDNMTWIGPLAVGIGAIAAAWLVWNGSIAAWQTITKIGIAVQAAFNAVMAVNPITLVIMAIVGLVAALVWFFTQTELGQQVWQNVTTAIAAAVTWLWESVLQPVFTAIGVVFTWIYENIILPIGTLIVNYFRFWGAIALWLWGNVLQPVFAAIGAVFQWVWRSVVEPIVGYITLALQGLGVVFRWLYDNIVKPVWDGIASAIAVAWSWIDQNVFTPFKFGIDLIGQAFEKVADGIGIAWAGIKQAAAVPINFVLDTVWNNGLRSFWNDLVDGLGLDDMKLPKASLVKFANGGVLPGWTPGRDVHRFFSPTAGYLDLSGGEAIMRPEFTRAVGGQAGVDALNAAARRGQIGDGFGDIAGDVWENVQRAAAVAWEFLSNPAAAIQKHVIDGIIRPLTADQNVFGQAVGGLAANTVKGMADLFKAAAPPAPGGKGMGWEAMWDIVRGRFPDATLNSALRPGAVTVNGGRSYHSLGRAIDLPPQMEIFNWLKTAFPNSSELIYSPAGARQLLNGKEHLWDGAVRAQHFNHVHWAMANGGVVPKLYDQGGWIPHGGMALNLSGRPEAVLTPDESQALKNGTGAALVIEGDVHVRDLDELFQKAETSKRRAYARAGVF